ncbi:MAG: type II/IV secretion system ATPase subunit, partial [Dehalococcoidia bacterium]
MATQAATLVAGHKHEEGPLGCPVFSMLPPPLQEESRNAPFLWEYLHSLSLEEIGLPDYAPRLGREHRELARPNLVYPTDDGLYAHILPDLGDSRDFYIAIEPTNVPTLPELMDQVDARLVDLVEALEAAEDSDQRTEVLQKCLDEMCTIGDRKDSWLRGIFKRNGKLHVQPKEMVGLRYLMVRDKVGLGVLEPLIQDPYIEDVSCSGLGHLFLEHRVFGGLKASIDFPTKEELDRFVVRLSEKIGRPVTYREPIIDAVLPDGSRVNIVFGDDVSRRGSNFTIRKFAEKPMSLLDLIETGSLNYEMAAYLSLVLREGMNVFISGETASGKTTLLNAITTFIDPNAKIVSIEDTPELQVPHPNWVREVSRGGAKDAFASSVTMLDLLKAALRQRPNEIIIGEIRGEEGAVAFQAMQTGHACMATLHA